MNSRAVALRLQSSSLMARDCTVGFPSDPSSNDIASVVASEETHRRMVELFYEPFRSDIVAAKCQPVIPSRTIWYTSFGGLSQEASKCKV